MKECKLITKTGEHTTETMIVGGPLSMELYLDKELVCTVEMTERNIFITSKKNNSYQTTVIRS